MRAFSLSGLIALMGNLFLWQAVGSAPVNVVEPALFPLEPFATVTVHHELKGQEETRVIASGTKSFYFGLYVFDPAGNCVAWDDFSGTEVRGDCAVLFVPPTQGIYTIEVRSYMHERHGVRLVIR